VPTGLVVPDDLHELIDADAASLPLTTDE